MTMEVLFYKITFVMIFVLTYYQIQIVRIKNGQLNVQKNVEMNQTLEHQPNIVTTGIKNQGMGAQKIAK